MSTLAELKAQRDELDRQICELEKATQEAELSEKRAARWVKAEPDWAGSTWVQPIFDAIDYDGDMRAEVWMGMPKVALIPATQAQVLSAGDTVYIRCKLVDAGGVGLFIDGPTVVDDIRHPDLFVEAE